MTAPLGLLELPVAFWALCRHTGLFCHFCFHASTIRHAWSLKTVVTSGKAREFLINRIVALFITVPFARGHIVATICRREAVLGLTCVVRGALVRCLEKLPKDFPRVFPWLHELSTASPGQNLMKNLKLRLFVSRIAISTEWN
ncbi:hypothetical protein E4U55_002990 [Claviceps digitariae]|nr:hypothetical protein E4U55_002990 [Claviceps digitariae]